MNHTPTPWKYQEDCNGFSYEIVTADENADPIADVLMSNATLLPQFKETDRKVRLANARHIVHCVNTHDALVKALRWAREELAKIGKAQTVDCEAAIEDVLALAEKGA